MTAATSAGSLELRPLNLDEVRLVEAYPLPAGVPDAIVNRAQLRDALDKSVTTLDAWRSAGMPVESEGTNGKSYAFRLALCYAWMRRREAGEAAGKRAADDAAAQLRLALTGGGQRAEQRARLTPKEQRETLQAELAWMQAARARGELLVREDVVVGLEAVFAIVRDALDALPDRAGRILALDGSQIEALVEMCDDTLTDAAGRVKDLIGHDDQGPSDDLQI